MGKLFTLLVFLLLVVGGIPEKSFATPLLTETDMFTSQLNLEVPTLQAVNIVFSHVTQYKFAGVWTN